MLDTCYAMLEFIVTVTVLLIVLRFHALVESVVTLGWQEVHASELDLVLQCYNCHASELYLVL